MATGDTNDMAARIASVLPARWFPDLLQAPALNAILQGLGTGLAYCYSLLSFVRLQARLTTSSGILIDIWADGWFGVGDFPRLSGETDAAYITRIQANLFIVRATRPTFVAALTSYAGAPSIIEPMNPGDTGGIGSLAQPATGGGFGLDGQGGLFVGSLLAPAQFFVTQPSNGNAPAQVYAEVAAQLPVGVVAWTEVV